MERSISLNSEVTQVTQSFLGHSSPARNGDQIFFGLASAIPVPVQHRSSAAQKGRAKEQVPWSAETSVPSSSEFISRPAENEKIKTNLELWAQDSILVIWMWNPRKIEKQTSSGFRSSNDASFLWEDSPKLRPMELVAAYLRRNFLVAGSNIIQWLWIAIGHLWLSTLR